MQYSYIRSWVPNKTRILPIEVFNCQPEPAKNNNRVATTRYETNFVVMIMTSIVLDLVLVVSMSPQICRLDITARIKLV